MQLGIFATFSAMQVVPYKNEESSKKKQVAKMFDSISGKYDFLNHFLSLGIDIRWRRKAIAALKEDHPKQILDIATGTGDLAIEALKLDPEKVIGVDISEGMLDIGREKLTSRKLNELIELRYGDSEELSFPDNNFDAVTVAFGVRNFENLEKGVAEIYRVLREGGKIVVLEFSKPTVFPLRQLYSFYFRTLLPKIGSIVSKDRSAYTYLPQSVYAFPDGEDFADVLEKSGFTDVTWRPLTFGISTLYVGRK